METVDESNEAEPKQESWGLESQNNGLIDGNTTLRETTESRVDPEYRNTDPR